MKTRKLESNRCTWKLLVNILPSAGRLMKDPKDKKDKGYSHVQAAFK